MNSSERMDAWEGSGVQQLT